MKQRSDNDHAGGGCDVRRRSGLINLGCDFIVSTTGDQGETSITALPDRELEPESAVRGKRKRGWGLRITILKAEALRSGRAADATRHRR
jgi:hypothetical protein